MESLEIREPNFIEIKKKAQVVLAGMAGVMLPHKMGR